MTEEELTQKTPFRIKCEEFYAKLDASAETLDGGRKIWRGSLTRAYREAGFPEGTYSRMLTQLRHLGCYSMLQRGNAQFETILELHHSPADVPWTSHSYQKRLTDHQTFAKLEEELEKLKKLVGGTSIPNALYELDLRLRALEAHYRGTQAPGARINE